jgi:hypothetical protein
MPRKCIHLKNAAVLGVAALQKRVKVRALTADVITTSVTKVYGFALSWLVWEVMAVVCRMWRLVLTTLAVSCCISGLEIDCRPLLSRTPPQSYLIPLGADSPIAGLQFDCSLRDAGSSATKLDIEHSELIKDDLLTLSEAVAQIVSLESFGHSPVRP